MAGALADDEIKPASTSTPTAKEPAAPILSIAAELPTQKLGLLRALLSIGDVSHSLFILAQFPFLVPAYLDLADLLLRLLTESINPAYATISISRNMEEHAEEIRTTKNRYSLATKSLIKPAPPPEVLSGRAIPRSDVNRNYVFFFAEWKDRLPRCEGWEDSLEILEVYLPLIGVFISRDFSLFTKICRIVVRDLEVSP